MSQTTGAELEELAVKMLRIEDGSEIQREDASLFNDVLKKDNVKIKVNAPAHAGTKVEISSMDRHDILAEDGEKTTLAIFEQQDVRVRSDSHASSGNRDSFFDENFSPINSADASPEIKLPPYYTPLRIKKPLRFTATDSTFIKLSPNDPNINAVTFVNPTSSDPFIGSILDSNDYRFDVSKEWPTKPDTIIMSAIACAVLPELGPNPLVYIFKEGRHHKVYKIRSSVTSTVQYLFRVCCLHDTYLKVASEVATITLLQQETSIPVAGVIAYDPSSANALKYSWTIVEYAKGFRLSDVWSDASIEYKKKFCVELNGYIKQTLNLPPLGEIGSIYFASDLEPTCPDDFFALGPIVDVTKGHRYPPSGSDRGPFPTIHSYMTAEFNNHRSLLQSSNENTNAYVQYYLDWISSMGHQTCVAQGGCTHFFLVHPDLVPCNIIVQANSDCVSAIIDWEGTIALPSCFTPQVLPVVSYPGATLVDYAPCARDLMSHPKAYYTSKDLEQAIDRSYIRETEIINLQRDEGWMARGCDCESMNLEVTILTALLQMMREDGSWKVEMIVEYWTHNRRSLFMAFFEVKLLL